MILGLLLFLGTHSMRAVAPGARDAVIDKIGQKGWMALAGVLSLAGFVLIIIGFGQARLEPFWLQRIWGSPSWTAHVTALIMLLAFISLIAAYVPKNHVKAAVGHPMILSVKIWSLGHLLANGELASVILFGSFLVWSVVAYASARKRDRIEGTARVQANWAATGITLVAGVIVYVVFAFYLHMLLIGRPVIFS